MNLAAWQTAECDGRGRTIRRVFGLRLVKDWIHPRNRLFGKAALQTLEPEDEIGFRNSMPPWLLHPHRGHGPQRPLHPLPHVGDEVSEQEVTIRMVVCELLRDPVEACQLGLDRDSLIVVHT